MLGLADYTENVAEAVDTMKRVALFSPPSPFLVSDRSFPFLGILWVAAALRRGGVSVEVLDLSGQQDYLSQARQWAEARSPEAYSLVGITATTAQFPLALRLLWGLKQENPSWRVGIGGAHATVSPQSCSDFDVVVSGDGMSGVLQALTTQDRYITGVITDMGTWPLPARDLIDLGSYQASLDGERCTSVMWSTGCPYHCAFCSGRFLDIYRKQRRRPIPQMMQELDPRHETNGQRGVWAVDDEVNIHTRWLLDLCQALTGKGYIWRAFVKAEIFTQEQAQAMKAAGCVEVGCGVESGSARSLQVIGKRATPDDNSRARRIAQETGIRFKAFCMIGLPGETEADFLATKEWLRRNSPDDFDLGVFTPYPGSPIYEARYGSSWQGEAHYDIEFPEADLTQATFYKGRPGEYRALQRLPTISPEGIVDWREIIDREVRAELGIGWKAAGQEMKS
mgnify:FL=1